MKHLFFIASCCLFLLLTSCNTNYDMEDSVDLRPELMSPVVFSNIKTEQYVAIRDSLNKKLLSTSRATGEEITEEEAMEILEPFAVDGEQMCEQILEQQDVLELSEEEIDMIEHLTPEEYAELSVIASSVDEELYADGRQISSDDVIKCLGEATGITGIVEIVRGAVYGDRIGGSFGKYFGGTKKLMTSKTAKEIVGAVVKRYVGWVGIAWMMIEFANCINDKSK